MLIFPNSSAPQRNRRQREETHARKIRDRRRHQEGQQEFRHGKKSTVRI